MTPCRLGPAHRTRSSLIAVTAPLLGRYMAHVYEGGPSRLDRVFGPVERLIYRACRIDPEREQRWNIYALVGDRVQRRRRASCCTCIQRIQSSLPFNPTDMANVAPALSFNTAVSFVTNTNWQSYGGENTLSHLTQMVGLTVQNFVSAAAGMAVMVAFIRGLSRAGKRTIGNFWVDLVRTTLRILLPLVVRVRDRAHRLRRHPEHPRLHRGAHRRPARRSRSPAGPVASQIAIKQLGTNGGGFFNVNSAHPFENPHQAQRLRRALRHPHHPVRPRVHVRPHGQGQAPGLRGVRDHGHPLARRRRSRRRSSSRAATRSSTPAGSTQAVTATSPGGNMEGKEVRYGPVASGHLGRLDDGHVERLRQLDARQLHARSAAWSRSST